MPAAVHVERASNNNLLWPPIADALDTFLRRRQNEAGPYERTWRLIHVWESVEVTLSVAALSRLCVDKAPADFLRRVREHFYGTYWDETTRSFRSSQGAADGSIDQWINILDELSKIENLGGVFLPALRSFLEEEAIDLSALVTAWGRACDVPPDARESKKYKVKQAMRHVNSLRNRLAHVPFPHDPLGDLAEALGSVTQQLFGIDPPPSSHEKDGHSSPLTGALRVQRSFLHGTHRETLDDDGPPDLHLVFPVKKKGDLETWRAGPFVYLDAMVRPHVLTRVKGFDACEYTRFRAEANAILINDSTGIEAVFSRPKQDEYTKEEEVEEPIAIRSGGEPQAISMDEAIEAIRREDYDKAITFFSQLAQSRPDYHVGFLRLGHAQREKGVRLALDDPESALGLLQQAAENLEKAGGHRDIEYQAQALYERSKALYHLARLGAQDSDFSAAALSAARRACELHRDPKYQTWLEHLQRLIPRVPAESNFWAGVVAKGVSLARSR